MKAKRIRLSNKSELGIVLALEPEGDLYTLSNKKSVLIDLLDIESYFVKSNDSILDLQISAEGDQIIISIWPENGNYEIILDKDE